MISVDLICEFAKVQALFEQAQDQVIIEAIQANAIKQWPRGIDDPAFI